MGGSSKKAKKGQAVMGYGMVYSLPFLLYLLGTGIVSALGLPPILPICLIFPADSVGD